MNNSNMYIYIGHDSRFYNVTDVCYRSIQQFCLSPHHFNYIYYLNSDFVNNFDNQILYTRPIDPLASTEFTYARFFVPILRNFKGKALFLDGDMLCFGNIREIYNLDMTNLALRVVKHPEYKDSSPWACSDIKMHGCPQTWYPRKNWSSLMLMNCEILKDFWQVEFCNNATGAELHQFKNIPDELIGEIPPEWNSLDYWDENTKMIHYTSGGPWFPQCKNHPFAHLWNASAMIYLGHIPSYQL